MSISTNHISDIWSPTLRTPTMNRTRDVTVHYTRDVTIILYIHVKTLRANYVPATCQQCTLVINPYPADHDCRFTLFADRFIIKKCNVCQWLLLLVLHNLSCYCRWKKKATKRYRVCGGAVLFFNTKNKTATPPRYGLLFPSNLTFAQAS